MIVAWSLSLILFSVTLAALSLLVAFGSRRVFGREPIAAHRFALLALGSALLVLPARMFVTTDDHPPLTEEVVEPVALDETEADFIGFAEDVPDEFLIEEIQTLRSRIEEAARALDEGAVLAAPAGGTNPALSTRVEPVLDETTSEPSRITRLADLLAALAENEKSRRILVGLAILHLLGALVVVRRRLGRLQATRALVSRARESKSPELVRMWRKIAGRRGRRVRLLISKEIDSPACFGIFRPALILPSTALRRRDPEALSWALRHELVHIVRGDCLIAPLQHLLVALAWFHPAAWWLEREIVRLRELSCDHHVVRRTGARRSYALALIEFARERDSRTGYAAHMDAPALIPWAGGKTFLQRRIEMLAHSNKNRGTLAGALRLSLLTAVCLGLWLADLGLAAAIPSPQEPPAVSIVIVEDPTEPEELVAENPILAEEVIVEQEPAVGIESGFGLSGAESEAGFGISTMAGNSTFGLSSVMATDATQDQDENPRFGLTLKDVDETLAAQLGIKTTEAIVVQSVAPGSAAAKAGLKQHDVIVKINGRPGSLANLRAERDKSAGKKPVALEIRRRARRMVVVVWGKKLGAFAFGGGPVAGAESEAPRGGRRRVAGFGGGQLPGAAGTAPARGRRGRASVGGGQAPGADFAAPTPSRRGGIGVGGGRAGAGPAAPSRRANNRGQYLREIEVLRRQLADLEARLRRDPQVSAEAYDRARRSYGQAAEQRPAPPTPRVRLRAPDGPRRADPGPTAPRRSPPAAQQGRDATENDRRRAIMKDLEARERALRARELTQKIDLIAQERHDLATALKAARQVHGQSKDKQARREIEHKIRALEEHLAEIEAQLEALRQELRNKSIAGRRKERSAVDPRAVQDGRERLRFMEKQVDELEHMLADVATERLTRAAALGDLGAQVDVTEAKAARELRKRDAERDAMLRDLTKAAVYEAKAADIKKKSADLKALKSDLTEKAKMLEVRLVESQMRLAEAEKKLAEAKKKADESKRRR